MIGSGQAPSSYTDALAAAAVAQQAIAGQQPGSLTAAQLLAAKQMQLQPPLNSFMPQGAQQLGVSPAPDHHCWSCGTNPD